MKHERGFQLLCVCPECEGAGRIEAGRCGPNDPDTYMAPCPECDGTGDVFLKPSSEEDITNA